MKLNGGSLAAGLLIVLWQGNLNARGVSPYLPLNLDPEIERQIERVLILADQPVLTRPIPAATVLDALPKACETDAALCAQVRRYLERYMQNLGITGLGIESAATSGAETTVPNQHGMRNDSPWLASASAYWQPSDYLLINLGGVAFEGDTVPTNSFVSLGFSRAQLDVGYRDRWLSPLTDSSMLLSTQAPTAPSATLSNYTPLTRLGLRYELFCTNLSESARIEEVDGPVDNGLTTGHPKLAGLHLSIEPASGWALGVNRLLQYGGGARGGQSIEDVLDAFFRPSQVDNDDASLESSEEFGNQLASFTSRFLFPGKTPFAVYFEYAGEDTSRGRNYLLGNSALSAGIHFPRIARAFDFTYEASEWQNGWYVHHIYLDGPTNEGHVLGHWAGDQRQFGDGVGGQSHMLRLGWQPRFGGAMEVRYRTLANESYSAVAYERAHDLTLRYTYPFSHLAIGGEVRTGRDVFGEDFSRIAAFVYFSERSERFGGSGDDTPSTVEDEGTELFIDAGVNLNEVTVDLSRELPRAKSQTNVAPHFAVGARRAVSERSDLGARLELDDIDGNLLLGVRALDYRYRFSGPLALTTFLGAARYDVATPAYGIYYGIGAQWRNVLPGWDIGLDLRYASKVARDNLLASDPPSTRPDSFYDISSATLSLSRRF